MVKRIYTADEQQQQAESQKAALLSEAESVIQPLERAVRLNMATDEERTRLEAWETLQCWSTVWIRQILNGHKSLNKN
ncbi:Putative phage tail assembly protein [Escherichia coli]|uniref:Phage tail assembly protein n=1 Tax=Escherichia coli TaxID=562 RepID=A0A376RBQ9_ECOLX|nr:Putative phage tail assembly protein [Escherichia coli]